MGFVRLLPIDLLGDHLFLSIYVGALKLLPPYPCRLNAVIDTYNLFRNINLTMKSSGSWSVKTELGNRYCRLTFGTATAF